MSEIFLDGGRFHEATGWKKLVNGRLVEIGRKVHAHPDVVMKHGPFLSMCSRGRPANPLS